MKVFGVERSGKEKIAISSRTLMEVDTNLASYFQNRRPDAIPHSSTKYEELKLVKIEKSCGLCRMCYLDQPQLDHEIFLYFFSGIYSYC